MVMLSCLMLRWQLDAGVDVTLLDVEMAVGRLMLSFLMLRWQLDAGVDVTLLYVEMTVGRWC